MTCCVPLLKGYFQGDDYYMDRLHRDGVVPGFFYYPLDGVDRKDFLTLRDQLDRWYFRSSARAFAASSSAWGLSILPVKLNPMLIFFPSSVCSFLF